MVKLKAENRKIMGRKVKTLRKSGKVPANIYGKDVKSTSIQIDAKELKEVYKQVGETGIVEIELGKETRPVLVHNVQVHPATDEILHVDFRQVNLKEKVSAQIPVEIVGESPVEKAGEGTVVVMLQELEVEGLPTELPKAFEIDATKLTEVEQVVKVSDLEVSGSIKIEADPEEVVVKVEPPQKEEVVEPVAPAEGGEVPAEGATEAPVEGEKPAEGEATPSEESKE
jgi:large subunit ribosomal protein L25